MNNELIQRFERNITELKSKRDDVWSVLSCVDLGCETFEDYPEAIKLKIEYPERFDQRNVLKQNKSIIVDYKDGGQIKRVVIPDYKRKSTAKKINELHLSTLMDFIPVERKYIVGISADSDLIDQSDLNAITGTSILSSFRSEHLLSVRTNTIKGQRYMAQIDLPQATTFSQYSFQDCLSIDRLIIPNARNYNSAGTNSYKMNVKKNELNGSITWNATMSSVVVDNDEFHSVDDGYGKPNQIVVDKTGKRMVLAAKFMTKLSNDTVERISERTIYNSTTLEQADLPRLSVIDLIGLYSCSHLSIINVDNDQFKTFSNVQGVDTQEKKNSFRTVSGISKDNILLSSCVMDREQEKLLVLGGGVKVLSNDNLTAVLNSAVSLGGIQSVFAKNLLSVGNYAFIYRSSLRNFVAPQLQVVGVQSFSTTKMNIDFPELTAMGTYAFSENLSSTYIDLPKLKKVSQKGFYKCRQLRQVNLNECTYIDKQGFAEISCISELYAPNLQFVDASAFQNCPRLGECDFSNLLSVGNYAFSGCTDLSIEGFDMDNVLSIGNYAFQNCLSIETLYLKNIEVIGQQAFSGATKLKQIYIKSGKKFPLIDSTAFGTTTRTEQIRVYVETAEQLAQYNKLSNKATLNKYIWVSQKSRPGGAQLQGVKPPKLLMEISKDTEYPEYYDQNEEFESVDFYEEELDTENEEIIVDCTREE